MNTGIKILLAGLVVASGVFFLANREKTDSRENNTYIADANAPNTGIINWLEFVSPRGNFEVILPSAPQYLEEGINIPETNTKRRYEIYASEDSDGTVYLVNIITYPKDFPIPNPQKLMSDVIQEMLKTRMSNRLEDTKETVFLEHPAKDFKIDNGNMTIMGRAFIVGQSVYLLTYISMDAYSNPEEYQRFLESFQFLPKV